MNNYKLVNINDDYLIIESETKVIYSTIYEYEATEVLDRLFRGAYFNGNTPEFMVVGKMSKVNF